MEEQLDSKRQKLQKKIVTHNGNFHCDEALACFMLLQTKEFAHSEIVRTRDNAVIETGDVVVDVGSVYDPAKHRYDHHQITFQGTLDENHSIRLSSAGLVYKHFGREVISNILGITDKATVELVYQKVYTDFVEGVDGIDNGVDRYPKDVKPKYKVSTDLGGRVSALNPWWNDPKPDYDGKFKQAVEITGSVLLDYINYTGKAWLPARQLVEKAIDSRYEADPSGEIIILNQYCPWSDHLSDIEAEKKLEPKITFVMFPDTNGSWRVQCVPLQPGSFANRLSLLWKGLRDDELSQASGIPGGIFVHASGFIGGNKTKEGALQMALKTLQSRSSN